MTATASDRRRRTLRAFLEQELSSPGAAIGGFIEMLIEDVRATRFDGALADLERMRTAGRQLAALVAGACAPDAARSDDHAADEARLRHELRTPLNAIKGYGEMLVEDFSATEGERFVADLGRILACTEQMLDRIGRLGALAHAEGQAGADLRSLQAVAGVLESVAPLGREGASAPARLAGRILVVDDEPANRDLLSRRLAREGHTVEACADGLQALDLLSRRGFDLVLLDMMMPGLSGLEVLHRLKADEQTRHVPVIVVSALDEIDSVVRCVEAGAEDYLPKTFNPTLLRARISASLEKKFLRDREEALLLSMLPRPIVSRMRQGQRLIADRFEEVTILFCDLVGFTPLAARLTPIETAGLLSQVFSAFDAAAERCGVEKIKTIGDAYMAVGGVPEPAPDHAERAARLALAMLEDVAEVSRLTGHPLVARIGLHSGEAVAGVLGTNRLAYDVWGDTVNTAARMESHGEAGRIQVSERTLALLGDRFATEPRGLIAVKGKDFMRTAFLLGPR